MALVLEPRILFDAAAIISFADVTYDAPGNSENSNGKAGESGGNQGEGKGQGNAGQNNPSEPPVEPPVVDPEPEPPVEEPETPEPISETPDPPVVVAPEPSPEPIPEPPAVSVQEPEPEPVLDFSRIEIPTQEEVREFYNSYMSTYDGYRGNDYSFDYTTSEGYEYINEVISEESETSVIAHNKTSGDYSGMESMTPEQMLVAGVDPTMIFDATASGGEFTDQLESEGYQFDEEQKMVLNLLEKTVGLLNCK